MESSEVMPCITKPKTQVPSQADAGLGGQNKNMCSHVFFSPHVFGEKKRYIQSNANETCHVAGHDAGLWRFLDEGEVSCGWQGRSTQGSDHLM